MTSAHPVEEIAAIVAEKGGPLPSADGSNWTRKTIAVWEAWSFGEYYVYKRDFYGPWHLRTNRGDIFTARSLQEVIEYAHAQAILRHHLQEQARG